MSVVDPRGVEVSVKWDGLSRQIQRRVTSKEATEPKASVISAFTITYNDAANETMIMNDTRTSQTAIKYDYLQCPISKVTPDESFVFKYDDGGPYTQTRLAAVESSKGVVHKYEYDIRGSVTKATLALDGKVFTTSLEWSPSQQLLRTINPDLSVITNSLFPNSETVQKIELADAKGITRASVGFDGFFNPYNRPSICSFDNGAVSKSQFAANGSPSHQSLEYHENLPHSQSWELDNYGKITAYHNKSDGSTGYVRKYSYDLAGACALISLLVFYSCVHRPFSKSGEG